MFSQILQGEDIVRERAIKFLSTKLRALPEEVLTKEVEELILTESKKVDILILLNDCKDFINSMKCCIAF